MVDEARLKPRCLFDAVTEYLATHRVAIPKYIVSQKLISRVVQQVKKAPNNKLRIYVSSELHGFLSTIIDDKDGFSLSQPRAGARSVMVIELKKELMVYHQLQPYVRQIDNTVKGLALSSKNQRHSGEMVDYHNSKLKRSKRP